MYIYLTHNITGRTTRNETFILDPSTRELMSVNSTAKDFISFISSRKETQTAEVTKQLQNKYAISYEEATILTFKLLNFFYDKKLVSISSEKRTPSKRLSLFDEKSLLSAYLTLTRKCNLSCKSCEKEKTKESDEVATHIWKRFISQICEWGVLDLYFIGGEPLLRKDCISLLKEAEDHGLPSTLFTTGLPVNDKICEQLSKIDSLKIQIFLHGYNASTCDSFVGVRGAYNKILDAIRSLVKHGIPVGVISVLREETINQMETFLRLLVNLGVSEWTPSIILPLACSYQGILKFNFSDDEFKKFMDEYFDLLSVYKSALPAKGTFNLRILQNKDVVWGAEIASVKFYDPLGPYRLYDRWVNVDANGDLTPSYRLKEYKLGNIKEKSVKNMLSCRSLIKQHNTEISKKLKRYAVQERCDNCRYIKICNGAIPEIFNKTYEMGDEWCDPIKCRFFHLGFDSILKHSTPPSYDILLKLSNYDDKEKFNT